MSRVRILDQYIFLRLPRITIDKYLNLLSLSIEDGLRKLRSSEYKDFLDILKFENEILYNSVISGTPCKKKYISILNYLMRATSRSSSLKGFAGVVKLEASESSNYMKSNTATFKANEVRTEDSRKIIVKNPALKIVNDHVIFQVKNKVQTVKSQKIVNFLEELTSNTPVLVTPFVAGLCKRGILKELNDQSVIKNGYDLKKRSSLSINLNNLKIDKKKLEKISTLLLNLKSVNGNDINKSVLWIEKIRAHLFNQYGTSKNNLLSLFLGDNVFRINIDDLFSESQKNVTAQRLQIAEIVNDACQANLEEINITSEIIKNLDNTSHKTHSNLSKNYGVLVKNIENIKLDAQLLFFRSSYNGLRLISDQDIKYEDKDDENSNFIFCDIIFQIDDERTSLVNRCQSTKYAISLDGTKLFKSQVEIFLENVEIYCSKDELIIYDNVSKKRIIPVVTASFLSENSENPLVRFFSALAKNHFNDGIHFDLLWMKRRFYPRISYENIVLYPKTWVVKKEALSQDFANILPEYIRIVNQDKDAFFYTRSEFFLDQVLKIKGDELIIQEDFSFESKVSTCDGDYFSEVFYSFEDLAKDNNNVIKFRPYEHYLTNVDGPVNEIRIFAPENYLSIILEMIYKKFLKTNDFFYIYYQIPSSHIRLRIMGNFDLALQISSWLNSQADLSISNVSMTSYENEISTYSSHEGVKLYIQYSTLVSRLIMESKDKLNLEKLGIDECTGPISSLIFLAFYTKELFEDEAHYLPDIIFSDNYLNYSYKRILEYLKNSIRNNDEYVRSLQDIAQKFAADVDHVFKEWNILHRQSKILKELNFFKIRVIHMEIFRLTNGRFGSSNDFVLKLAKDIIKNEQYS